MAVIEPIIIQGTGYAPGRAEGEALVGRTRISFWGGFDPKTGTIVQEGPLQNKNVAGKILIFVSTKGSSGTSGMISLAQLGNNHPLAFINTEVDCLASLACSVCNIPMVADLDQDPFHVIKDGDYVRIDGDTGVIEVFKGARPV
jgi:predicted aconitase with swiveling domain